MHRHSFGVFDTDHNKITLLVDTSDGNAIPQTSSVNIDSKSVSVPASVICRMIEVPEFDYVNEIVRSRILLDYLMETKQKALIVDGFNLDQLMSSRWAEVFRVTP